MKMATSAQMKRVDERAINTLGIPSTYLMENAAEGLVAAAISLLGELKGRRIAVFCGSGNNGGDGVCAARKLLALGASLRVFLVGEREKLTPDTAEMERRLMEYGGRLEDYLEDSAGEYELIIDAVFGVGLNTDLSGKALSAVRFINKSPAKVISADIPSGLAADSGQILGGAVRADVTVTFSLPKPGHFMREGRECCGDLIIHDIGLPEEAFEGESLPCTLVTESEIDGIIPIRSRNTHKGDYGRVLLICGSEGYTGAAALTARAALKSGAGLVSLGVPLCVYPILASKLDDEVMVFPLPDDRGRLGRSALDEILSRAEGSDSLLIGPGLGRSDELSGLVGAVLKSVKCPVILDADGINAVAGNIDVLKGVSAPLILTPHEGEFKRLGGLSGRSRLESAVEFARAFGVILMLKGPGTVTALPDGRAFINSTGNPGMATGGSGDVLAGLITSLAAQGIAPEKAAYAAAFLHGRAGDICADAVGEYGMTPSDIIQALPKVMRKYQKQNY